MDGIEQFATQLERLTGDPIADAVPGFVRVVSVSEPKGRFGYEECALELMTEAPGVAETLVRTEIVTQRKSWPKVGQRLPARISTTKPGRVDVDWDALGRASG